MRLLFLIGNGFDLNLGMKTTYREFYKYYLDIYSESPTINELKKGISSDFENWSDLELALGAYTYKISTPEKFDEIYEDLEDRLADFLKLQEDKFDFSQVQRDDFLKDLMYPENFLPEADKLKIKELREIHSNTQNIIDLMVFNYTRSIEHILGDNRNNIRYNDKDGKKFILRDIEHIHGFVDERMVMGVNDISQITNHKFHSNPDILETLIKNDCNKVLKHNIDEKCKNLISNANLICIFGCSIGDTDKLWWEFIANELKKQSSLIIFNKDKRIKKIREHYIGRRERKIKEKFLSKVDMPDEEKAKLSNKIFVGINTNIFNLIKKRVHLNSKLSQIIIDDSKKELTAV